MVFIDMDVQIQLDGWTDGWPRLFKTVANKKISKWKISIKNNNNNDNNNNDDDDDDNAYSAHSMHMRDQLSFTEVPKKYINANKKTEKTTLEKASGNKKYIFSV